MQAIMESLFDVGYLVFAILTGVTLLQRGRGAKLVTLFGLMSLILGGGDAFHLVPRVMNYWMEGDFTAALGIGTLITSITMTVFYLMLEYARRIRYGVTGEKGVLQLLWILTALRIALCLFPQNHWTSPDSPVSWGIIRNIPFVVMGTVTIALWLRSAAKDKPLRAMWLAITLSFLFYLPVVLFADAVPMVGMLMLPKTIMYIWMLLMMRSAAHGH